VNAAELKPLGRTIITGPHPQVLLGVVDRTITLAVWCRQLADDLAAAAKQISEVAFELVISLDPWCDRDRQRLKQELTSSTGCDCATLADDLIDLSQRYAQASQNKTVRIRLETVKDDGCRKFHLDNVPMRLVVTYAGPGIQLVPVMYSSAASEQQEKYNGPLNSIETGEAAIFIGKKSGRVDLIFHRSPPMKPSDSARLVAVIDGVYA